MSTSSSRRQPPLAVLVSLLLLITLLINGLLLVGYRQRNMQSFLAGYIDKQALLENTPGPRILLVGGSSVGFGFRSNLISSQTGLPVINLSIQGGLGVLFDLEHVKPYLQDGDVIIYSPEYHSILARRHGGSLLTLLAILQPSALQFIDNPSDYWEMIESLPFVHTSAVKGMLEDLKVHRCFICANREAVYFRAAWDTATGDIALNDDVDHPVETESLELPFKVNTPWAEKKIEYINDFYKYAQDHNVKVFFYYPSVVKVTDPDAIKVMVDFDQKLRQEMQIPILNDINNSQYENDYMYDTAYHLNGRGEIINTAILLNALCVANPDLTCQLP